MNTDFERLSERPEPVKRRIWETDAALINLSDSAERLMALTNTNNRTRPFDSGQVMAEYNRNAVEYLKQVEEKRSAPTIDSHPPTTPVISDTDLDVADIRASIKAIPDEPRPDIDDLRNQNPLIGVLK